MAQRYKVEQDRCNYFKVAQMTSVVPILTHVFAHDFELFQC